MVCLRNLLRNNPPLAVVAVERQNIPGGIWTGHIPPYSTLQDLKIEYEVHGVKFPEEEPERRAPRDQVAAFCDAYVAEFKLREHVLWQHEVTSVEMIKPMLHRAIVRPVKGAEGITTTIFTRSVLVCRYVLHHPSQSLLGGVSISNWNLERILTCHTWYVVAITFTNMSPDFPARSRRRSPSNITTRFGIQVTFLHQTLSLLALVLQRWISCRRHASHKRQQTSTS